MKKEVLKNSYDMLTELSFKKYIFEGNITVIKKSKEIIDIIERTEEYLSSFDLDLLLIKPQTYRQTDSQTRLD